MLGVLVSFEKYDQVLSDKALNAVVICTPTVTHCDLASKAIEKGVPVLLEKPVATNIEDVARLYDLVEKKKGKEIFRIFFS